MNTIGQLPRSEPHKEYCHVLLSYQVVRNKFYVPKPNFKTPAVAPSVTMGNKT